MGDVEMLEGQMQKGQIRKDQAKITFPISNKNISSGNFNLCYGIFVPANAFFS